MKNIIILLIFSLGLAYCGPTDDEIQSQIDDAVNQALETTTTVQDTTTTTVQDTTTTTPVQENNKSGSVILFTKNAQCTIPELVIPGTNNFYEVSKELGLNIPKKDPEFCLLWSDSIPENLREYQIEVMNKLIDYVGGYDRWVHVIYEIEADNTELLNALDQFGYFYDENGNKQTPTIDIIYDRRSCLSGFGRNKDWTFNQFSFCNQPYPYSNPDEEFNRNFYGEEGFLLQVIGSFVHEYYHHVQRSHTFGRDIAMENDCCNLNNPVNAPAWYVEGQAQVFPTLFFIDNFNNFSFVKDFDGVGACENNPVADPGTKKGRFILGSGCNLVEKYNYLRNDIVNKQGECTEFTKLEEYRETGICNSDGWQMINFYLAYITSFDTLFINLHEDVYQLGFESSFEKHVGLSLDDFYKNFNQFIMDNTVPPVGFFPTKPLNELVDFYSINSG